MVHRSVPSIGTTSPSSDLCAHFFDRCLMRLCSHSAGGHCPYDAGVTAIDMWAIVAGGSIGAVARYLIGLAQATWTTWPGWIGILIANLIGCLVVGFAVGIAETGTEHPVWITAFVITGICGALTTMSGFALDLALLLHARAWAQLSACSMLTLAIGIPLVIAGSVLSKAILGGAG